MPPLSAGLGVATRRQCSRQMWPIKRMERILVKLELWKSTIPDSLNGRFGEIGWRHDRASRPGVVGGLHEAPTTATSLCPALRWRRDRPVQRWSGHWTGDCGTPSRQGAAGAVHSPLSGHRRDSHQRHTGEWWPVPEAPPHMWAVTHTGRWWSAKLPHRLVVARITTTCFLTPEWCVVTVIINHPLCELALTL